MTSLAGRAMREAARLVPDSAVLPFSRPSAVFFHGVESHFDDPELQNNHHSRDNFIAIVRALKARFDVVPLSALDEVLKDPVKHARAVFLMADDGYANMREAADILEDFALPWTLFVSTRHIDTAERNPVFRARLFLRYARGGRYELPHLGVVDFLARERADEERRIVAELKHLDAARAEETLAAMERILAEAGLGRLPELFPSDAFLSWDQLRDLAARGVTIGAHAHWHWPMNTHQTHEHLVEQAALPRRRLIAELGSCAAFSYPFGNIGDVSRNAWKAVRDAGYDCAFTTLSGTLDASTNRFLLPRYGIGLDETHLTTAIPMLRAGNRRLRRWQQALR